MSRLAELNDYEDRAERLAWFLSLTEQERQAVIDDASERLISLFAAIGAFIAQTFPLVEENLREIGALMAQHPDTRERHQ